jgi:serine/threonine protein kinase/Flp pilus assembly protein TadD
MQPDAIPWDRIDAVLEQVLDLSPEARRDALDDLCGGDPELREAVERLLTADESAGSFLETPALEAAAVFLTDESDPPTGRAGDLIGPYRLVRPLGHGGMGSVYLAERADGQFEQQVALKLTRAGLASSEVARRFREERQILAHLEHPNIAGLLDGGVTADGEPWFAMEYVAGEPLTTWCDARRLGLRERVRLFESVCDAVHYAHRSLVVHRDLKPSNILVDAEGRVRLLDFGIAKVLDEVGDRAGDGTRTGLWVLTPEYGAPEQVRGDPVTTATDVYALGAVLFELLTGHRVHRIERHTPLEIERVICETLPTPPSRMVVREGQYLHRDGRADAVLPQDVAASRGSTPRKLGRELAGDLDAIVLTALQKDPARRYSSADGLREDLRRWLGGRPVRARRDSLGYRARKFVARNRLGVAAGAALALAVATGVGATWWQASQARQEAARARGVTDFLIGLFRVADPEESRGRNITAKELLARGVMALDTGLTTDPRTRAELFEALGVIHRELGLYDQADTLLQRALDLGISEFGPDDLVTAGLLTDYGSVLRLRGEYAAAESALDRALSIRERHLGRVSPEVAFTLGELAATAHIAGADSTAEALYRETVRIDSAVHGSHSLELATDLDNFGAMLLDAAEPVRADTLIREGLAIRLAALDSLHPSVLTSLYNLGAALNASGDFAEAERIKRLVLASYQKIHPDGHPDVAFAWHSLGKTLEDEGAYAAADSAYQEAITLRRRFLGPHHWQTLGTLNNLGTMRYRAGDLPGAEQAMREVLTGQREALGPDHPLTYTAMNNLGVILLREGKYDEAESLLLQALHGRRHTRGDDHSEVAGTVGHLVTLYRTTGRPERAEAVLADWLDGLRQLLPDTSPQVSDVLIRLARVQCERGSLSRAMGSVGEGVAIRERIDGPDDARTLEARSLRDSLTSHGCVAASEGAVR